jgi:PBSX family phage terminase large subunit
MLRDATVRSFLDIAGDAVEQFNKAEMVVKIKHGGEILFRSADNPDRLRGPSIHWAHIDEAAMCPSQTWDIIIGRLRADGKAGPVWVTSTPKGRNWLFHRRAEMTVFQAKTADNPYLAQEFIDSLKKSYVGEFAKQELEGEFISLEGLVYPMFSSANVVEYNHDRFQRWALAMDEGYTNPAVILLIGIDGDGRLHIAREYYQRGKLQRDVVRVAAEWDEEKRADIVAVDASAAGLIADLKDIGLPAVARKGRVLDGITLVQSLLKVQGDGLPRLTVDPSCTNTINEFESYVWREGKDEPVKEFDHALDALRYYAVEIGEWMLAGRK